MVRLVSRSKLGWSSNSPSSSGHVRSGVALHYNGGATGLSASASHSKCISYWQGVARYHRGKWSDIGYSWGVCPHGYLFEGRGFDKIQAAQPGGNSTHQSITLMIGGNERPGQKHVEAVREAIAWLRGRGVRNQIRGHRDFYSTSCPGNIIYGMMQNGAFNPSKGWSDNGGGSGGGGGSKTGDFLDMSEMQWASQKRNTKLEKNKPEMVRWDNSSDLNLDNVNSSFVFENKKVMGLVHVNIQGLDGGRARVRFLKHNYDGERIFAGPWTVIDRYHSTVPLAFSTWGSQKAQIEVEAMDGECHLTYTKVQVFVADR